MDERRLAAALVEAYDGRSLAEAAATVGVSAKRARRLLLRYKVPAANRVRRQGGRIPSSVDPRTAATEEEAKTRAAALAALSDGLTVAQLAALFETSKGSIGRLLRAAGIQRRRGRPASMAADEVQRLRACGWTYSEIGDVLGRSARAVAAAYCDGRRAHQRVEPAEVLRLRDVERLPWREVGRRLDCHPDTAKKAYHKARRAAGVDQRLPGSVGCSEQNIVRVPSR